MALVELDSDSSDLECTNSIADHIKSDQACFLEASTPEDAIKEILFHLKRQGYIQDVPAIREELFKREQLVSTGIGKGIAMPHARTDKFNDFILGVGIHKQGLDWPSEDHLPVQIVVLILGPDDKQIEYLQLVSDLAAMLREEHNRKLLIQSRNVKQLVGFFTQGES